MTLTLTEKLKAAGTDRAHAVSLPRPSEASTDAIHFRHLAATGEFVQSVSCYPGCVTVVQENQAGTFRQALLGRSQAGTIDIRSGTEELHQSELGLVQNHDRLSKEPTVTAALKAAGAPAHEIPALLKRLGLEAAAEMSPRDLGLSALNRLSIGCSMYARARILLCDRPFLGSDPAWVERIAQLLLQLGESNARAVIVLGESQIPRAWRSNSRVLIQDPRQAATGAVAMPERSGAIEAARRVLAGVIVTRPQSIYGAAAPRTAEMLRSEAIQNPNAEIREIMGRAGGTGGLNQVEREAEIAARKREQESMQPERSKPGELTQVTGLQRVRLHPGYRKVEESVRKLRGRISARPAELDVPPAVRISELNRRVEFRYGVAIFVLAVLAMILLAKYAQ